MGRFVCAVKSTKKPHKIPAHWGIASKARGMLRVCYYNVRAHPGSDFLNGKTLFMGKSLKTELRHKNSSSCGSDLLPLTFLVKSSSCAKLKTDKINRLSCSSANVISMLMLIRGRSVYTFYWGSKSKERSSLQLPWNPLRLYSHKTSNCCVLREMQ